MTSTPFFTVIIPTYNRADMIAEAVQSVLDQDFDSFEVIVVDDGSKDNTGEIVKAFTDERVHYVYQDNAERAVARNNGVRRSKGKYIAFLDSDDQYLPIHLSSFYKHIEAKGFPKAMFYGNTYMKLNGELSKIPAASISANNNIEFILMNTIGIPRMVIHREILVEHPFNEEIFMGEEKEMYARALRQYDLHYNPDYTQSFTEHPDRTVAFGNTRSFLLTHGNIKMIIRRDKDMLSKEVQKRTLGTSHFNIARSFMLNGKPNAFLKHMWKSLLVDFGHRRKEKIYLMLSYSILGKILLRLLGRKPTHV